MYRLVDIDTHTLEVYAKGEGQPIVLLPGLASSSEEWKDIIEELSKHANVISFHRAGLGKSTLGSEKRCAKETANDLKLVLEELQITLPIVLVGHSYGGFIAQYFSFIHPTSVKSLVLVESSSFDFELLNEVTGAQSKQAIDMYRSLSALDRESIIEKLNINATLEEMDQSDHDKRRLREFKSNPVMYRALADELEEMPNDANFLKQNKGLAEIPLRIIGRDPDHSIEMMIKQGMPRETAEKVEEVWQKLIKDQLKLSANSTYTLAEGSYHNVNDSHPDIVIQEVVRLL
ncbi:alpha/beta fold hydrolase [Virgibacillus flavescens]|uniref:alpha/beta fold hydrolase n=1 Tax=Virgibacillus flavescens TaxID=1611422 RepID=UPI003D35627A